MVAFRGLVSDIIMDMEVCMEDVNACDGIGRCLRVLSRRRRNAHG